MDAPIFGSPSGPYALMLEERNLKLDLVALGLLALTIFLTAALLSYNPADAPGKLIYPELAETSNVCGRSGATVSMLLLSALGLGAYYLLVSLAVLDSVLLARRTVGEPLLRAVGWLLSLVGVTTLAAMAVPQLSPGPVIGSGGYLGAAGCGLLQMNFASVGAYILTVSMILGGLLLCTDYFLVRLFAWTVGVPSKELGRGLFRVGTAYAGKFRRAEADEEEWEEEEEEEEEEEPSVLAVRIAGRDNDEDEEKSGEEEEDEQEDAETESAGKKRPGSGLRIRKPKKTEREEVIEKLDAVGCADDSDDFELPSVDMLLEGEPFCFDQHEKSVRDKAKVLERTFGNFGFNVRVVEIQTGPVIAQFEVELEAGLRLSRITSLADDLAIALRVPSVRIVAPIPGKNTVGIEIPNDERQLVRLREVMEESNSKIQKMRIPIFLGKDVAGNPMVFDLASLPHLLIAGQTGTGKSVCLNSIIISMLMTRRPDEVRLLLIDPKMVELSPYNSIRHLMHPVVTDMRKAEAILAWAVDKMEERYALLARAGVRHISVYNQLGEDELMERIQPETPEERQHIPARLPFIVLVADEIADLMMTSAKEVESHIIRLAQKSRAVGIHLVLATQKPTVDVITGLIKSNLPARISFQVASRTDSRVVLDEMGAEKLLGDGDLLFLWPGTSTMLRGQGTYVSDDEITQVIDAVATTDPQFVTELVQLKTEGKAGEQPRLNSRDDLYEGAVDVVVREGRGSVSLLQRTLGIGYGRAARLIDYMAEDGIVGPYNGSQAREVTISVADWELMSGQAPAEPERSAPAPLRPANKILISQPEEEEEEEEEVLDENAPWEEEEEELDEDEEEDEDEYEEEDEEDVEEDEEEYEEDKAEEEVSDSWTAETA